MKKVILVKFGGSLITDKSKPYSENRKVIKDLAKELHSIRKKINTLFIVGHGGGSYPHVPALKYKTAEGVVNKSSYKGIAEVQDAAARLNRIVTQELINVGENAISLSPSSFMVTKNRRPGVAFLKPLLKVLEFDMLPVIYGDVVFDEKLGCSILSTELILNFLALKVKNKYRIERIIYCGVTNGVYDKKGKTIVNINSKNYPHYIREILGSEGIDVTGGMTHKVKESLKVSSKLGIKIVIINSLIKNELTRAVFDKRISGTYIKYA